MLTPNVCKILKCDGLLMQGIAVKLQAATPYGTAYGVLSNALGEQVHEGTVFADSAYNLPVSESRGFIDFLDACVATLNGGNPDAATLTGWASEIAAFTAAHLKL